MNSSSNEQYFLQVNNLIGLLKAGFPTETDLVNYEETATSLFNKYYDSAEVGNDIYMLWYVRALIYFYKYDDRNCLDSLSKAESFYGSNFEEGNNLRQLVTGNSVNTENSESKWPRNIAAILILIGSMALIGHLLLGGEGGTGTLVFELAILITGIVMGKKTNLY